MDALSKHDFVIAGRRQHRAGPALGRPAVEWRAMSFLRDLFGGERRAAERDLQRRIETVRQELRVARAVHDLAALAHLRHRLPDLGLTEDDVALELEMADGLLDVAALQAGAARGEGLPVVQTNHRALGTEPCHFLAPAWRPDESGEGGGKLLMTPRRLVFLGAPPVTVSWAHVAEVSEAGRDIVVRVRPDRLVAFRCNSYNDTVRGVWLAQQLTAAVRRGAGAGAGVRPAPAVPPPPPR